MSSKGRPEMTPDVLQAFAALRADETAPRAAAAAIARAAMHRERVARGELRPSGFVARLWTHLCGATTPRRVALTGSGFVAAVAAVALLGWNAPAGSALHAVRVVREQIALAVSGADRAGLELSDAETRLRDAADGTAVAASLDEASHLLDNARGHLPGNHSAPPWARWRDDEAQLATLRAEHDGGHDGDGSGASGSSAGGGAGSSGDSGSGSDSSGSGASGPGGSSGASPGFGSTGGGGSRSSTSTSASSSDSGGHSSASTTSSSTFPDGGGGSSSSTTSSSSTSSTSSTSDHGGSSSSTTSGSDSSGH